MFESAFSKAVSWLRDTGILERNLLRDIPIHALPNGGGNVGVTDLSSGEIDAENKNQSANRRLDNKTFWPMYILWALGNMLATFVFAGERLVTKQGQSLKSDKNKCWTK